VLHVGVDPGPAPAPCPSIDPGILLASNTDNSTRWAFEIEGNELAQVLAIAPANPRAFVACGGGVVFHLAFLPAVPGADLSQELEIYHRGN
jgi:hypothetical protein